MDMKKSALGLTAGAVTGAVGASVLGTVGGPAAAYGATGIVNLSSSLPTAGSIAGAGMVLGELKKLKV